ncbi:mitotic interactor and substrate of PLK1 isoform X2 [Thalassophryne amazonica]|uniref:mitotic interactor and substrate of PLK1 isoform X2 n=1 Tax=Thalassophryne amazonica TaxID=390379 RepID=UPI001470E60C|nr:mitotic interactor and substrate of PLK1 isoform X2 [Thalassophryne amazonica]
MMDSSPRRWILKPLSPVLQSSDLRTVPSNSESEIPNLDATEKTVVLTSNTSSVAHSRSSGAVSYHWGDVSKDVEVDYRRVAVLEDSGSTSDEWHPSSPGSSISSNSGFYAFVEDPTSPEAVQNEMWMVSPQRQAHLLIIKEDQVYKVQTYTSSQKPKNLFQEIDDDLHYKVDEKDIMKVVGEKEEQKLRKEIIRGQAPKKSLTVNKSFEDRKQSSDTNCLIEGFSLCYSSAGSKPDVTLPDDPETIDREQINFRVARQQFLKMEHDQQKAFCDHRQSSKTPQHMSVNRDSDLFSKKQVDEVNQESKPHAALDEDNNFALRKVTEHWSGENLSRQSSVFDDWDLQSEDDTGRSISSFWQHHRNSRSTSEHETPIEREIRLIQEREMNLRLSRGLMDSSSRAEMVEIKTRCVQGSPVPFKAKEKNRVSIISKTEIHKESQVPPEKPMERKKNESMRTDYIMWPVEAEAVLSPCCPHRHTEETELCISKMSSGPTSTSLGGLEVQNRQTKSQQDLTELKRTQADRLATSPMVVTDGEDKLGLLQSSEIGTSSSSHYASSFALPSTLTPQYHPSSTWTSTSPWSTPHSWRGKLQSRTYRAPDFIEKEIEESLRREEELRQQRESKKENLNWLLSPLQVQQEEKKTLSLASTVSPALSLDKDTGEAGSLSSHAAVRPSISFITAQPWTGSSPSWSTGGPVVSSSSPLPLSSLVLGSGAPPQRSLAGALLQEYEERTAKLKLEESSVVESTRVTRHKNQRALRWEAGIFTNQLDQ